MDNKRYLRPVGGNLEKIILSVLAEYVVEQAAERLAAERRKALILFDGSFEGFPGIPAMLEQLQSGGWDLKAVLSESAENVLNKSAVESSLPTGALVRGGDAGQLRMLVEERSFLFLPTLTVNGASKIAHCMADDLTSNAAALAIAHGKQILACVDGCCPDRRAMLPGGFQAPEPYREQMRQNLRALASYGIRLTDVKGLAADAEGRLRGRLGAEMKAAAGKSPVRSSAVGAEAPEMWGTIDLRGLRVIGKSQVMACGEGRILVGAEAVVTQTALEEAERKQIMLVKG